MKHPKANKISITITPSSRPSTMDDASSPCSGITDNNYSRRQQQHSSEITATSPPPQQYTFESSPASSSTSSFGGDYIRSTFEDQTTEAAGRHVQGLPASALATVDAFLNRTPPRREDIGKFDMMDSDETDEDEHNEIDHHHQQKRIEGGGRGGVTRDYSLEQEPKVPKVQSQRHIRLAHPPLMTTIAPNKGSSRASKMTPYKPSSTNNDSNRATRQRSVSPCRGGSRPEDSGETEVDRSSTNGSHSQNGGHFYNFEHNLVHPQQQQHQPSGYNNPHQNQSQYQHQNEKQDQLLEMYRTKSFMSELSFERNGGGGGVYGDEAGGAEKRSEYFAAMNFQQDPEMERQIVRKLDRHLLPLLGILYLFSYLDRVNIGNARLFGLEEAVHLSNGQYNIALASFFLAYCLFELPSNWMLVRLGPRTWIPLLMFLWGGVSLALAWVTNFTGLVIARFALGTAEAGFVPGVLFYLTLFYKRSEHSFRMAIFLCFNILAGAFGGLLAAGISQLAGKWNLQGWQWIFILEAIPTLLLATLTWFIMTPSPMQAKFLTEEERIYATNRIIIDTDVIPTASASWRQTRSALTDVRVYLICLGSMLLHLPSAGVVMFLPSLIADMGFKATTAQLLTVPPYMVAACVSLLVPWWSDRLGIRGYFAIFIPIVSVTGFFLLAFAPWTWPVTFALCGMVPTSSILTSWLTNNCIGHAKRATALAMMISAGSLAGMAGTQVYRLDDAPRYQQGHIVMAISICCFILNAFVLRTILSRENHRRDNNQTKGLRLIQFMSEGHLNDLGDMHPNFRYTL
ncbi:hypothetical protein BG015_000566 [Linnemannia schmuckeri]|uniref:Major facilitator superfamily (MFS) profile domain-containing protein n=1 Tax=Linnemannia schmuckeri TaxID=64567 RepID=A0A9P5RT05_9FUNG|nr:hypothetical protein BG015_000566 [Linnemannia schmuckeri]